MLQIAIVLFLLAVVAGFAGLFGLATGLALATRAFFLLFVVLFGAGLAAQALRRARLR